MRAIGLDVGSKTIGVAISDELGLAAHPTEVIARRGTAADVAAVMTVCRAREISAAGNYLMRRCVRSSYAEPECWSLYH